MNHTIHDLFIENLDLVKANPWRALDVYAFDDHLLKRIGTIEVIELTKGASLPTILRSQADELWTLLNGDAVFEWVDGRENSPSFKASHTYSAQSPVRVLVPFGVEFRATAQSDCTFLRICSHAGGQGDMRFHDA